MRRPGPRPALPASAKGMPDATARIAGVGG